MLTVPISDQERSAITQGRNDVVIGSDLVTGRQIYGPLAATAMSLMKCKLPIGLQFQFRGTTA